MISSGTFIGAREVTREDKKVLAATLVGTAIEWYDFFIFAQAAGIGIPTLREIGYVYTENRAVEPHSPYCPAPHKNRFRPATG